MAADDIKIPLIGEVPKKYALGGVAVTVVIVGVVILRKRNAANSAGAANAGNASVSGTDATGGMVTDPAGNVCAALDGNSGYCPGSAEDQAYQSQQTGYGISGYGGMPGLDAGGYPIGSPGDIAWQQSMNSTGNQITTNDEWIQQALTDVPGDPGTIQQALAAVLGGLTVTTAQKNLFLEAVGINQEPPQGYPKPIKTLDTPGHPGGGGGTEITVPYVVNLNAVDAQRDLTNAGFKSTLTGPHFTSGHGTRIITHQKPSGGTKTKKGSSVALTYKIEGAPAPHRG
jgi:hypothetical protein